MNQTKKVWASNQTVPKFIINPETMLPQLVPEDEARYNQYVIRDSRRELLYQLEKDTNEFLIPEMYDNFKNELKYAVGFKNNLGHAFNMFIGVFIGFPILLLTSYRIKRMLNKSKKTNPEWWI